MCLSPFTIYDLGLVRFRQLKLHIEGKQTVNLSSLIMVQQNGLHLFSSFLVILTTLSGCHLLVRSGNQSHMQSLIGSNLGFSIYLKDTSTGHWTTILSPEPQPPQSPTTTYITFTFATHRGE